MFQRVTPVPMQRPRVPGKSEHGSGHSRPQFLAVNASV